MKKTIFIVIPLYIAIAVLYSVAVFKYADLERGAKFGDMYGAFNAFFSGLAFLGVIAAVLLQKNQVQMQSDELRLQREELALQRQEMASSREELARQARAQEASTEVLHIQCEMMRTSARLNAIPQLIKESAHALHHRYQLEARGIDFDSVTVGTIEWLLQEKTNVLHDVTQKIKESSPQESNDIQQLQMRANHLNGMIQCLRTLLALKYDLLDLYNHTKHQAG